MCLCAEYFLFAAVPVVQGGRPAAGRGPVCRDHQRPGRDQTLCRLRGGVYAKLQPGQILPGLCGAGTPEERGRTPAKKIPPVYAFRTVKVHGNQGFFRMVGRQVDKVILFSRKQGSKCGKMDKKEAPDAEALTPPRPAFFHRLLFMIVRISLFCNGYCRSIYHPFFLTAFFFLTTVNVLDSFFLSARIITEIKKVKTIVMKAGKM